MEMNGLDYYGRDVAGGIIEDRLQREVRHLKAALKDCMEYVPRHHERYERWHYALATGNWIEGSWDEFMERNCPPNRRQRRGR